MAWCACLLREHSHTRHKGSCYHGYRLVCHRMCPNHAHSCTRERVFIFWQANCRIMQKGNIADVTGPKTISHHWINQALPGLSVCLIRSTQHTAHSPCTVQGSMHLFKAAQVARNGQRRFPINVTVLHVMCHKSQVTCHMSCQDQQGKHQTKHTKH